MTFRPFEYHESDGQALYDAVPTWQPHPNVVEVLEAIAPYYPAKAFIDRGHEPASTEYGVSRLTDVRQLPALLDL